MTGSAFLNIRPMLSELIRKEGEYVNHPDDRGGPTKYGVTEQVARAYGYSGDMRNLPLSVAEDIYVQRYWIDPKFDLVALMSPKIAQEMFDTGINMGQAVAVKFLQRALNVLNRQSKDYPDITVDGVLGAISLRALQDFINVRGKEGEAVLFRMLNAQQSVRYMEIAERNPNQESFQYGWQKGRVE